LSKGFLDTIVAALVARRHNEKKIMVSSKAKQKGTKVETLTAGQNI
jgi:hypothetical protein